MNRQLIIFSGGLDSTVLLKYLLQNSKNPITVLFINYINHGYQTHNTKKNFLIQKKVTRKLIKYFKKKYRNFDYREINFGMTSKYDDFDPIFFDDQHAVFLAGYYIINNKEDIKDVWIGHFSYNDLSSIQMQGRVNCWFFDGSLEKFLNIFNLIFNKKINLKVPSLVFKGKEIDCLPTKKEAFNYLEKNLQDLIRSCFGDNDFCGECFKCKEYKFYLIK